MTQLELARMAGIRRETLCGIEKSKFHCSLKMAYKISKALGVSIDELIKQ